MMHRSESAIWIVIRDWRFPDFPPPKTWYARKLASIGLLDRLRNDLLLFEGRALGLITAYRQWLYLCALEGRRMQASDLVVQVERIHREAGENWAALVAALPEGALVGDPAPRSRENDADYRLTLERLRRIWAETDLDHHFWPAPWRYDVERKLRPLALISGALFATGGLAFWGLDVGGAWPEVFLGACVAGILGLVVCGVVQETFAPFHDDDRGG